MSEATKAMRDFLTKSPSVVFPDEAMELFIPVERENAELRNTTYAWRMVDRLSSENAKLREQVIRLQADWESERDYANQMEAKEKKAVNENIKLRKLVQGLWFALLYSGMNPDGATGKGFARQMRKLGIEVRQ